MNNSFLNILSRHQVILTLAIFVVFLASGAFFYGKLGKQTATVEEGKCSTQSEIDAQKSELANLNNQAATAKAEIEMAEKNIVASSASDTTVKRRIEELKTEIQSDYAVSLENENVNRLCSDEEGVEPPECTSAKKSYSKLIKENEANKAELKALEAKEANPNADGTQILNNKKKELDTISLQISDLTQSIAFGEANICPPNETK